MKQENDGAEWRKATAEQIRELARIRQLVSQHLRRLRRRMRAATQDNAMQECLAEVVRLSQLQMKVIPLEQGLRRDMAELPAQPQEISGLSEEDWRLLEDALRRRNTGEGGI